MKIVYLSNSQAKTKDMGVAKALKLIPLRLPDVVQKSWDNERRRYSDREMAVAALCSFMALDSLTKKTLLELSKEVSEAAGPKAPELRAASWSVLRQMVEHCSGIWTLDESTSEDRYEEMAAYRIGWMKKAKAAIAAAKSEAQKRAVQGTQSGKKKASQ